jgi:hypothetical protein
VAAERRPLLRTSAAATIEQGQQGLPRQGSGMQGAWWLVMAVCGWRELQTRREVGGFAG